MDSWSKHYIPAGCLRISTDVAELPPEGLTVWTRGCWHFFDRDDEFIIDHGRYLPRDIQEAFLNSPTLAPFSGLFNAGWIQLSFQNSIIRVYIYPHDVDRQAITRPGDARLLKTLSSLLKQLDYSPITWSGSTSSLPWNCPASNLEGTHADDDDCSLLERFNDLPSPDPQLDLVTPNSFNAIAMQGILDSKLPGLRTTLYAHQRRSAAVMLQREVEPGRVVDPRLRYAIDQHKQPWYFDAETGLVLREPRLYDGASGGILAEEMGTGKTLICLAVILATKHLPTEAPDALTVEVPSRPRVGSLIDMAAATINKYSFPWKAFLATTPSEPGEFIKGCVRALQSSKNRAYYELRNALIETRKGGRTEAPRPSAKIYLSSTSIIIVPNNLVTQWQQEIAKHTSGLKVLTMTDNYVSIPPTSVLLDYDIILISQSCFETNERSRTIPSRWAATTHCPLDYIRFKRCIIDEGHRLGSTRGSAWKTDLMRGLERLQVAARWVVTGTPSRGLYGVVSDEDTRQNGRNELQSHEANAIDNQEREDLLRIGSIASKFLKVRPWSNTRAETGDTPADWRVYVMQPRHYRKSSGRKDCLKATLESLIIRNRLSDVSNHLPPVDERIVLLDGSYQDKLSLNLFSMMIVFNSVQSERTDQDYFFHPRQRKALDQLVNNLKQASFFGGVFYSAGEIETSLKTAQDFLEEKKVPISSKDYELIVAAMEFGRLAAENRLKAASNRFHAVPLYLEHFPGGDGKHWSLDDVDTNEQGPVCTDAGLIHQLQKFLNPCMDAPTSLNRIIENGELALQGDIARQQAAEYAVEAEGQQSASDMQSSSLAGNTTQGIDHHIIQKTNIPSEQAITDALADTAATTSDVDIAVPLARTRIISTVSAKLSYLVDAIVKYQDEEQIIVFYENDNVAWYLAGVLEILQIQHLIYTRKGLDATRRAQYVSTFTHNPKFRVLLMDISQAAFGLDMRSASRIYFISPVLNPQVEAQAIGRARRISQKKPVTVETLVLRDSIEEFMVERRKTMTQAEHRKVKSILDDKLMHDWILNAKIIPMPEVGDDNVAQTARLKVPQYVFGRGFGRESHPDADLVMESPTARLKEREAATGPSTNCLPVPQKLGGLKRSRTSTPAPGTGPTEYVDPDADHGPKVKKRSRVAFTDDS
ncbi:hypothetical protein TruAng_000980 [Truncatella angustata]|nr:hypothetical protein TruAng_000980 [Truncatella angustata]